MSGSGRAGSGVARHEHAVSRYNEYLEVFEKKNTEYCKWIKKNKNGDDVIHGIGVALAWHGAGFTGSGEVYLASVASV